MMKNITREIIVVVIALLGFQMAKGQSFKASAFPDRIILTWSADPMSTQSVTWRTDTTVHKSYAQVLMEDSSPDLEKDNFGEFVALTTSLRGTEYEKTNYHSATMTGLKPDQVYT
jgi:acid phosphatase type 7